MTMALVSKDQISTIADAVFGPITDDVAGAIAPDVEYRLRELIQVGRGTWPSTGRGGVVVRCEE